MSTYRNKAWYKVLFTGIMINGAGKEIKISGGGMSEDKAYELINENLQRPSFIYEPENAYAAFQEVYGRPYASPQEMKAQKDQAEIERLREENEQLRIAAKLNIVVPPADGQSELGPDADTKDAGDTVIYKTKDEFKKAHPEIKGIGIKWAWIKYMRENGIIE